MTLQSSLRHLIRELWLTKTYNAKYIAYKFDLTEQSVRSIVSGLNGPKKEKHSLSAYHRAVGMKLISKRLSSQLNKKEFSEECGMSHFRLNDLEKGYDEITISEIVRAGLLEDITLLDSTLLENE